VPSWRRRRIISNRFTSCDSWIAWRSIQKVASKRLECRKVEREGHTSGKMYFRAAFLHTQKQNLCAHPGCDRVFVRKLTFCSHFLASSLSFWFVLISSLFLSVNDANALVDLSLQSVLASEYTPSMYSDCSVAPPVLRMRWLVVLSVLEMTLHWALHDLKPACSTCTWHCARMQTTQHLGSAMPLCSNTFSLLKSTSIEC